jgi:hypothetical protein
MTSSAVFATTKLFKVRDETDDAVGGGGKFCRELGGSRRT